MLGIPFECTKVPSILLQHHDDDKENSMPGRENHREDLWRLESRLGRLENLMKECLDEVTYCKSQIVRLREHFGHKADPLKPSDKRLGALEGPATLQFSSSSFQPYQPKTSGLPSLPRPKIISPYREETLWSSSNSFPTSSSFGNTHLSPLAFSTSVSEKTAVEKSESLRRVTRSQTAGVAPNTAAKLESSESVRRSVRANWDNSRTPSKAECKETMALSTLSFASSTDRSQSTSEQWLTNVPKSCRTESSESLKPTLSHFDIAEILEERETLTEPVANQKRSRIWSVKIKFPSLEKSADDVVTKAEVTLRRNPIDNSEAYWLIARDYESLILEHPLKRSDFKETKDCDFEFEATFEGGQGGPVGRSASATNIFGYIFRVSSKDYRTKFMNELRKRCQ